MINGIQDLKIYPHADSLILSHNSLATVGYQGTFFNFVAQGRGGMPYPLGGLVWFGKICTCCLARCIGVKLSISGIDDASHSYRTPMYSASQTIPMSYAETNGNATKFVLKSAFWIFNLVANMAYARYDLISPEVQSRVVEVETEHFRLVSEQDNTLLTVLATSGKKAALKQLTEFSVQTADSSIDQWVEFWQLLVVRHRDGLVVTPVSDYSPGSVWFASCLLLLSLCVLLHFHLPVCLDLYRYKDTS